MKTEVSVYCLRHPLKEVMRDIQSGRAARKRLMETHSGYMRWDRTGSMKQG